jgi:hypothetical protein
VAKTAVMEWLPSARAEVVKVAVLVRPAAPLVAPVGARVAVPIWLVPSKKATVPVGAAKLPVSVAVKATGWPRWERSSEALSVAVVMSEPTVTTMGLEVEGAWVASPLKVAVKV